MSFVHLHNHSEYSLLEASSRVKAIAKKAAEYGMPAVALTDNGNLFGAIEFYFACLDKGVKPILGMDAYLAPQSRLIKGTGDKDFAQKSPSRLVLLAQNLEGYRNLSQLSTIGYQEGFYYKPRIDYEVVQKYSSDLICLSGGLRGDISQTFLNEGADAALQKIKNLQNIFGDRFFLEINRTGVPDWKKLGEFLLNAGNDLNIKVVAANDVHYLTKDDQMAQEVLICIGSNRTLHDETRFRLGTDQFYFKSAEEMKELFSDLPETIQNTLEITERCQIKFKLKDDQGKAIYHLPSFPTTNGATLKEEIYHQAHAGLKVRFEEGVKKGELVLNEETIQRYTQRLDFELSIIEKMGFNGYFLIVADFINWAKKNRIPVGPGRGSGAGSLVAYSLRITDLDPLPNFLLFERFLNPERISMPDFDIDFCQDLRGKVIEYVTNKYGPESVSQIITYGKLQTRAAIKDVGRVLGMTFAEVDVVSKLIPDKLGITLTESIEMEPRLKELMEMDPQVATLMELALKVEGLVRHAGIHAAGVIIADGQLVRHAPLYRGADGENVVQFDMKHAEKIGLIKFDFLGLKTLTHIRQALNLIEKNKGIHIEAHDIPMNDPKVFETLSKGDSAGIFQFEGDGITDATRKIKPTSFGDVTAITSLYRPGPMANIPEFAKRKHGEAPIEYLLDDSKEILEETYGIMVYQEQVMGIASKIAGYSLGEADMLRRAMGKKIKEEMDQHRERFLKGAAARGHNPEKSNELFDLMYKFADYGFNKSHAAAYSVVTLQTAWLKTYYRAEFFAALLSTEMGDTDKIVKYSKDAQKGGVTVHGPHVNHSEFLFTVKGETIYFGLGGIKGVGSAAVDSITEALANQPDKQFKTLDDFFNSIDLRRVNKKVIECLIKAGALDGFGAHRAQLMASYTKYLDVAENHRKDRDLGQVSLFSMMDEVEKVVLNDVKPWSRLFALAQEKDVLGFYLSDHPLKGYEKLCEVWTTCEVAKLSHFVNHDEIEKIKKMSFDQKRKYPKKMIFVSGLIATVREMITKKGTRMAFGTFEDLSGSVDLVIFPDAFAKVESLIKTDGPVVISGQLDIEETGNLKIIVDQIFTMDMMLNKTKNMILHLEGFNKDQCEKLKDLLKESPGQTRIKAKVKFDHLKQEVLMDLKEPQGVMLTNDLLESIHASFGRTDFISLLQ